MLRLVNGQNLVWPGRTVRIEVHARAQCDLSALLLGADSRVRDSGDLVFYNQPSAPGVQLQATPQALTITLDQVPTERVACVLSVDPDQPAMGASPPPLLRFTDGSTVVAEFTPAALTVERAIVACEIYHRAGVWKVRALGQGYQNGLAQLVREHGVEVDDEPPAPTPTPLSPSPGPRANPNAVPAPGARPQAAPGPSPHPQPDEGQEALVQQQRLFTQCSAIMDDASRSTASLLSTRSYAESSLQQRLESLLDDPRMRIGAAADEARRRAQHEHDELIARATANHRRDLAQLDAELRQLQARLPAPMARWSEQVWQGWQPPAASTVGIRLGELTLADAPELRLPLLVARPLRRPLWIDPEVGGPHNASAMLRAVLTRLLACHHDGAVVVHAIDPAGQSAPLAPIGGPGCTVQTSPTASTLASIRDLLNELTSHVDRVEMAAAAGMLDAVDARERIVVLHDFPTGLDDGCLALIRHLIDVGGQVGVQFILTGSQGETSGPVAAGLFRQFNHVPAGEGGSLRDGFGDVEWGFVPDLGPDPRLLDSLLARISRGQP